MKQAPKKSGQAMLKIIIFSISFYELIKTKKSIHEINTKITFKTTLHKRKS